MGQEAEGIVYIFLADGFEETEALTPADYLRRAGLEVKLIGVRGKMVRGSHGITLVADGTMYDVDVDRMSMIVLPGGVPGTPNLEKSHLLQNVILHCAEQHIPIGAICAAPSILGHLGLLREKKATCFPGYETELEGAEVTGAAAVIDGDIVTGKGAGASNQFAFALIERMLGKEKADEIAAKVQWQ